MDEDWGTDPRIEAGEVRLREVLTPRRTTMTYVYDVGDDWVHRLVLTNIRQGEPGIGGPRYIAGDPSHREHQEIREWLGDYDPNVIDELQIKISIGRIAKRRKAAKAGAKKHAL